MHIFEILGSASSTSTSNTYVFSMYFRKYTTGTYQHQDTKNTEAVHDDERG